MQRSWFRLRAFPGLRQTFVVRPFGRKQRVPLRDFSHGDCSFLNHAPVLLVAEACLLATPLLVLLRDSQCPCVFGITSCSRCACDDAPFAALTPSYVLHVFAIPVVPQLVSAAHGCQAALLSCFLRWECLLCSSGCRIRVWVSIPGILSSPQMESRPQTSLVHRRVYRPHLAVLSRCVPLRVRASLL